MIFVFLKKFSFVFKRQPAWLDASSGGASVCLFFFARDFMSNAFADFNQSLKEVYDAYFVPYDAFRRWSVCVWLVFEAYLGGFGRCLEDA